MWENLYAMHGGLHICFNKWVNSSKLTQTDNPIKLSSFIFMVRIVSHLITKFMRISNRIVKDRSKSWVLTLDHVAVNRSRKQDSAKDALSKFRFAKVWILKQYPIASCHSQFPSSLLVSGSIILFYFMIYLFLKGQMLGQFTYDIWFWVINKLIRPSTKSV